MLEESERADRWSRRERIQAVESVERLEDAEQRDELRAAARFERAQRTHGDPCLRRGRCLIEVLVQTEPAKPLADNSLKLLGS